MTTVFSILAVLVLAMTMFYLIHRDHESYHAKAYEIRFVVDGELLGAHRDVFSVSEIRSSIQSGRPITRVSTYGKVVSWDFRKMKATWWFQESPDVKHTADITEITL